MVHNRLTKQTNFWGNFCFFAYFVHLVHAISVHADFCLALKPIANYTSKLSEYADIEQKLFKKLEYELLPQKIIPLKMTPYDSLNCEYYMSITIDSSLQGHILLLNIGDFTMTNGISKLLPMGNKTIDELLDLIVVQLRFFLEKSLLSNITVSSNPLGCNVLINGKKSGKTPLEVLLKPGQYSIEITNPYFYNFIDSIYILPGQKTVIKAEMKFKESGVRNWFIIASLFSGLTGCSALAQYYFHQQYLDIPRFCLSVQSGSKYVRCSQKLFDSRYNRYQAASYTTVALGCISTISWSVWFYNFKRNNSIKASLYNKIE